ncbi:MAG: hypothetical protein IKV60_03365, partial [Rikenellaceae bacterium]|nr:hypothetical protein [Rikenellaceae bacterium]
LVGVKPEPEAPQVNEDDTEEDVQDDEPMTTIRVEGDSAVEILSEDEDDGDDSLNPHAEQLNLF